jgi:hypothetical protein
MLVVVGTVPVSVVGVAAPSVVVYVEYRVAIAGNVAAYVTFTEPLANAVVPTCASATVSEPRVVESTTPFASVQVYETCPFASEIADGADVVAAGLLAPECVNETVDPTTGAPN